MQGHRPAGYVTGELRLYGSVRTLEGPCQYMRRFATVGEGQKEVEKSSKKPVPEDGPLKEYENRIVQGRLKNDPYQRRRYKEQTQYESATANS